MEDSERRDGRRKDRKVEHLENYLKSSYRTSTLLEDVYLDQNALPDMNFEEVDTSIDFLGKKIPFPLMIDAITGGCDVSEDINEDLANLAEEFSLPMACGSESISLEDERSRESFKVLKERDIIKMGNLGANHSLEELEFASDLIGADAFQIHLNPTQELVMEEGDRNFKGYLDNIQELVKAYDKPIIVKEVGFGLSKEVGERLYQAGVRYMDVAGKGGTNFIEIEDLRTFDIDYSSLYNWGIPTAKSIIDIRSLGGDIFLIGSGGIRSELDLVKALVLGADLVGISGEILSYLLRGGYEAAEKYLEDLIKKTKIVMTLLGAKNIGELKKTPYKLTGKLKELCQE